MDHYKEGQKTMIGGTIANIVLFIIKLIIGIFSNSLSIMADAFNNLSDSLSTLLSVVAFKMARKKADNEHPFGHGRIEYISGLFSSFMVVVVGAEFFKTSIESLFVSRTIKFGILPFLVLLGTIIAKMLMAFFYKRINKSVNSSTLRAAMFDSVSDALVTTLTALSLILHLFYPNIPIDSIAGIIVSLFIIIAGIKLLGGVVTQIIGSRADQSIIDEITKIILGNKYVLGVHGLVLHDYGIHKKIATAHAEMLHELTFDFVHTELDHLEKIIKERLDVDMVIHGDPVLEKTE